MKRIFATLVLTISLLTPTNLKAYGNASIQPLQTKDGRNFCTSFSLDERHHYYATAGHCVNPADENLPLAYMYGMRAQTAFLDVDNDIAVVQAAFGAPAMKVSLVAPKAGDPIHIIGHPFGWTGIQTQYGVFLAIQDVGDGVYAIFDLTVAPGNSGSPVLDINGRVISILQVKWNNTNFSGGTPFLNLRLLEPYEN